MSGPAAARVRDTSDTLSILLPALLLLLISCTGNTAYRGDQSVKAGLVSKVPEVVLTSQPYTLAFLEFDDNGDLWTTNQLYYVLSEINAANKYNEGVGALVITYVHGWKDNASPDHSTIFEPEFRSMVKGLFVLSGLRSSAARARNLFFADLPPVQLARAEIMINLHNKTCVLRSWGKSHQEATMQRLEDSMVFSIVPNEEIFILIEDPNPFSSTYSWIVGNNIMATKAAVPPTTAETALVSLLGIIKGLEPSAGGSAVLISRPFDPRQRFRSVMLAAYRQDIQPPPVTAPPIVGEEAANTKVQSLYGDPSSADILQRAAQQLELMGATESMTTNLGQTRAQDIIEAAVASVKGKPVPSAGSARIRVILKEAGVEDPETFLKNFKGAVATLYLLTAQARGFLKDVNAGRGDAAKAAVSSWPLSAVEKQLDADYDLMHRAADDLQSKLTADDAPGVETHLAQDPFFLSLIFILPSEADLRDTLKAMLTFKANMRLVNVPIQVGEIDFSAPRAIHHAKLRIEPVLPPYSTLPLAGTKEYNFVFSP